MVTLLVNSGKTPFNSLVITFCATTIYFFMFHIHLCENRCDESSHSSIYNYNYISHMHFISVVLKYVPSDFFFNKLLSSNAASYNTYNCVCEYFDSLA